MWQKRFYSLRDEEGAGGGGGGPGGGGGGGEEPWYEGLAPAGTELPAMVTESADFEAFVKQATDYQAMQGSSLRIPGENASVEDRAEFYQKLLERVPGLMPSPDNEDAEAQKALAVKLGVPEAVEGYETPAMPDGRELDKPLSDWFHGAALGLKLSKGQAKGLFEEFTKYQLERETAAVGELKAQDGKLREDWGATYDPQMKKIRALLGNYAEFNDLVANMDKGLVPAHVYRGFAKIAEGMMGEGFEMLQQPNLEHVVTPNEAALQVQETIAKLAKLEPNDPARGPLMQKLIELQKQAMPDADHTPPARAGFSS